MNCSPIRVGVIGVHPEQGWAAAAHLPALKQLPGFTLQAISHHRAEVAKAAAEKFDVPSYHLSSYELVTDPNIDLVVVAVKVTQHRELITQAIEAGKMVFSEWPLAVDLAQATALNDLASKAGVRTAIGLQTRSAPAFSYLKALIGQGHVGRVLSATLIGSGIVWGEEMSDGFEYTLDRRNGASMLQVPFAHSLDGLLHALDQRVVSASTVLSNSRDSIRLIESGRVVPLSVPDQIQVSAQLDSGAALTAHFRGGLCQATNFHVEVNGTEGDLLLTSPVGYVGIGGTKLQGARRGEALHALVPPQEYDQYASVGMPAQNIAIQYARIADDLAHGTRSAPNFTDAVQLHRLIDALENNDGTTTSLQT
jgi:predicted dehydrogenase